MVAMVVNGGADLTVVLAGLCVCVKNTSKMLSQHIKLASKVLHKIHIEIHVYFMQNYMVHVCLQQYVKLCAKSQRLVKKQRHSDVRVTLVIY